MKKLVILLMVASMNLNPVECKVTEVVDTKVTCEDASGNLWEFNGSGFETGEKIQCLFDTMGTEDITDDKLIWARQKNKKGG